jgi:hypothetical protein
MFAQVSLPYLAYLAVYDTAVNSQPPSHLKPRRFNDRPENAHPQGSDTEIVLLRQDMVQSIGGEDSYSYSPTAGFGPRCKDGAEDTSN